MSDRADELEKDYNEGRKRPNPSDVVISDKDWGAIAASGTTEVPSRTLNPKPNPSSHGSRNAIVLTRTFSHNPNSSSSTDSRGSAIAQVKPLWWPDN
jgi:hypothetical protein